MAHQPRTRATAAVFTVNAIHRQDVASDATVTRPNTTGATASRLHGGSLRLQRNQSASEHHAETSKTTIARRTKPLHLASWPMLMPISPLPSSGHTGSPYGGGAMLPDGRACHFRPCRA